eukprot:gnl/TRDRNA2_/TRDRNA2_174848_c0_seq8.p3 gnl/TRDRNA2_/TRDRNA2_174848_c0~~gnl/TRDRNA2_/TRDRNA2_174848_c0_seq8.p3  ORF type:complete len:111 (+),score=46.99 gnl/TRDRNA2_/TRDRNA2_174848_c0_seq8:138-470(+)
MSNPSIIPGDVYDVIEAHPRVGAVFGSMKARGQQLEQQVQMQKDATRKAEKETEEAKKAKKEADEKAKKEAEDAKKAAEDLASAVERDAKRRRWLHDEFKKWELMTMKGL